MRRAILLSAILLTSGVVRAAGADGLAELPANTWTKLPVKEESGYSLSQMIYVPPRGQLLHWGACVHGAVGRNDVRAFDAAAGDWASDYRSTASDVMITGGGGGTALSFTGKGEMRPDGTPKPAGIVNGVCWDSKREQLVYTMAGLMAAYDPKTRKWTELKAKTIIDGKEFPGGPPVYGIGTGYDPVNDEIVLFPHFGGSNRDLMEATGRTSGHWGTFVYSFKDNTWRRPELGGEETRKARQGVVALLAGLSQALDELWVLRRRTEAPKADLVKKLEALVAQTEQLKAPESAKGDLAPATPALKAALAAVNAGKFDEATAEGTKALWALEFALDRRLRVEPPPRCATPLVYVPKLKALVMFGGQDSHVRTDLGRSGWPGGLNDTWLYDCQTRQWRELECRNRPPETCTPEVVFDPVSGEVLLVTRSKAVTIWGLDAEKAEWSRLHEQPAWPIGYLSLTQNGMSPFSVGLDEKQQLLVMTHTRHEKPVQEAWALKLDVAAMKPAAAPLWQPLPAVKPIPIPADDPAWLAKLKALPANEWVAAGAAREPDRRDWGVLSVDPITGWVGYFGGGHATYQVNDVAVYYPGANRWEATAGEHNDYVPPANWQGSATSYSGGPLTGHRGIWNEYTAVDGRVLVGASFDGDKGSVLFSDLWRGGLWRHLPVAVQADKGIVDSLWGDMTDKGVSRGGFAFQFADEAGHAYALRCFHPKYGSKRYFYDYDAYNNKLTVKLTPPPFPGPVDECSPVCHLADKGQMLFFEFANRDKDKRARTWVYDIKENKWTDLQPKKNPDGFPLQMQYVPEQKVVYATVNMYDPRQWVYSLERNTWAPMEWKGAGHGKAGPYGQFVYVRKYGVFVAVGTTGGGTKVMRPDFSQIKWE